MEKVLILLGCPESPSQTPLALYTAHKLTKMGFDVTVTARERFFFEEVVVLTGVLSELS